MAFQSPLCQVDSISLNFVLQIWGEFMSVSPKITELRLEFLSGVGLKGRVLDRSFLLKHILVKAQASVSLPATRKTWA